MPTSNYTLNLTGIYEYENMTQYCPITPDQAAEGWTIQDFSANCQSLMSAYCDPPSNATAIPSSTTFPASCSPEYYLTTSSTSALPTQSGIPSSCDAYYAVKANDTCAGIVSDFGNFTLTQFYR